MGRIKDITGQRFGKLVVLEDSGKRQGYAVMWKCRCDCGNITYATGSTLKKGNTKSCGCLRRALVEDLTGRRFGHLTVLEKTEERRWQNVWWKCQCDCGKTTLVPRHNLITGNTKSCGCLVLHPVRDPAIETKEG